ncbi:MAG: DNA repair protein RecN [Gemmatimonadota bacterium]
MLRDLRIQGYAVIDDLSVEMESGLTVLTGETGAGKSILVGALTLLLGGRANTDSIRAGAGRTMVEGVFEVDGASLACEMCRDAGIDPDDGSLILRREAQRAGRSRGWVNGSPVTAGFLRDLGSELVELHGQHEHQALLRRDVQRTMLDAYGESAAFVADVAELHGALSALRSEIERRRQSARDAREKADYLRFKAEEIEAAALEPGEDDKLENDIRRLEHSEDLLRLSGLLVESIQGDADSLTDRLAVLQRSLSALAAIDAGAAEFESLYATTRTALDELGRGLSRYRQTVEHDPQRLHALRERMDEVYRLKRKYGGSLDDVIEAGAGARADLDEFEGSGDALRALEDEATAVAADLEAAASRLSAARQSAATRLESSVVRRLPDLGLPGAQMRVDLTPEGEVGRHGRERIEFLISLNPGFDPGPLGRVASGGELSRLMLALRTALSEVDPVPTVVFDEIDAGIGGQVAHEVGAQLAAVASRRQVLAVTHLAQIASRAGHHLQVGKSEKDGLAVATVVSLSPEARVAEVARMLGGDADSDTSRQHAEEMLESAAGRT